MYIATVILSHDILSQYKPKFQHQTTFPHKRH